MLWREITLQRDSLAHAIQSAPGLPEDLRAVALRALATLPDGAQLCHGDFHPDNVLMTTRGPIIIDWMMATRGNPLADVARTLLLFTIGEPPSPAERLIIKFVRRAFIAGYLARYFELRPSDQAQLDAWKPIIAAARLNERIPNEQTRLLEIASALIK